MNWDYQFAVAFFEPNRIHLYIRIFETPTKYKEYHKDVYISPGKILKHDFICNSEICSRASLPSRTYLRGHFWYVQSYDKAWKFDDISTFRVYRQNYPLLMTNVWYLSPVFGGSWPAKFTDTRY
jgi:hypothetical protein